jgi:hypothetical protein
MSAQDSVNVRALFAEMGIELEKSATSLVIDRFEQWRDDATVLVRSTGTCICRVDVLEAA